MTLTNIISAIGNNSSIYPLLVRDCCIEAPSKILIARKENMKESKEVANDATREKFIDEYFTSAIWLGGIPLTEKIVDKFIVKKGYNPNVNLNLFKADNARSKKLQGIQYNIDKFSKFNQKDVQQAVADLIKVRDNKPAFEKLLTKKFAAATIIPTVIMGFILPPLNFALTRKLRERRSKNIQQTTNTIQTQRPTMQGFVGNKPTFTGNLTSTIANLRTVDKMAISDGGLTVGRVSTSRNKEEAYMNAFRMIGSIILNFVTPAIIAKGLDKFANKAFGINVNLDPIIMADKKLIDAIKTGNVEIPKSGNAKVLFDFIDSKPESFFSQAAQKMGKISYLESGIRDPRKFIDLKDLRKFRNEFKAFVDSAITSGNVEKFANKAKRVKYFNILANVGISSFLLAGVLPKAQYEFNKLVTGSYLDPGLAKGKE